MGFELITVRYSGIVLTYLGFRKSVYGPLSKVYTKPTDKHQYVHIVVSSCHPQHTKRAITFSLALRLRRICSNPDNFKLRTNELHDYLANRGYDKNLS